MESESLKTALFLDRDGVINEDYGYVHEIENLELKSGIEDLLIYFSEVFDYTIVVSNQSGIGRGFYSKNDWNAFNNEINRRLKKYGVQIDEFYCCPHVPEEASDLMCPNRKPNPGMLFQAQKDYKLDLTKSILVGDRITDVAAADKANLLRAYLFSDMPSKYQLNEYKIELTTVTSLKQVVAVEHVKTQELKIAK